VAGEGRVWPLQNITADAEDLFKLMLLHGKRQERRVTGTRQSLSVRMRSVVINE